MEWEFTAEDIVKGRCNYDLKEFRHDLAEEVRRNMGDDENRNQRTFALLYDLCYAMATDKDIDAHLADLAWDPPTTAFLRQMQPLMTDNAQMLGAILQRRIMDAVEAGMPLATAVQEVAAWHAAHVDCDNEPQQQTSDSQHDATGQGPDSVRN